MCAEWSIYAQEIHRKFANKETVKTVAVIRTGRKHLAKAR